MMTTSDWNATLYDQKHGFVADYGQDLVAMLAPQPGERILDLGCGTGHLTQRIAATGAHVVGIDSSPAMIAAAQAAYPTLDFQVADAREYAPTAPFDAIFSNAALHWIPEPEKVVARMAAALRHGGRLVAEFGGQGNVATIITATQAAIRVVTNTEVSTGWYFPAIGAYAPLLEAHGLRVNLAALFPRPTRLEDGEQGLSNWLQMFGAHMLQTLPAEAVPQVLATVAAQTRADLFRDGSWYADYVRLRVVATKV